VAVELQGARRIAWGAALAAVLSTVLVGIGAGVGTADEVPAAVPVAQSAPRAVPVLPEQGPRAAPTTERASQAAPRATAEPETTTEPEAEATTEPASRAERQAPSASVPVRSAGPSGVVAGTPCTATAKACVDLAARKAWLFENGAIRRGSVTVMIGDEIDPTPVGTFLVEWKAEQWTSREYLTQMPYAVFFAEGGIAFHEGPQDTNSAGCVKLTHQNAVAWFEYLQVGDEVQVR